MADSTETQCPGCGSTNRVAARFCRHCGKPLAGHDAPPVPPDPPVAEGIVRLNVLRRKANRRALVVVLVVLLLICGYGIFMQIQNKFHEPADPVKALFAALDSGDFDTAGKLAGCAGSPLCKRSVLAEGYTPPVAATITTTSYNGPPDQDTGRPNRDSAWVGVEYRLGERKVTTSVRVDRDSSGWFRRWHVSGGGFGLLDVISKVTNEVKVALARLATIPEARDPHAGTFGKVSPHPALPGLYTIVMPEDPLFDSTPIVVAVPGAAEDAQPTEAQLGGEVFTIKPAAVAEVTRQMRVQIDECAERTDLYPLKCPFQAPGVVAFATEVRWTVVEYPQITFRPVGSTSSGDDGYAEVTSAVKGKASATYVQVDRRLSLEAEIDVDGVAFVDDSGKVVFRM